MKLLVIGHGKHGKDTAAEMLSTELQLTNASSSWVACVEFVFDRLGSEGTNYASKLACWKDRRSSDHMRARWFDLIAAYNTPDPAALAKLLLSRADIYTGMRSRDEYDACAQENLFDLVVWVEAFRREQAEGVGSMQLSRDDADIIIDNNGTPEQLAQRIRRLCKAPWVIETVEIGGSVTPTVCPRCREPQPPEARERHGRCCQCGLHGRCCHCGYDMLTITGEDYA